MRADVMVPRLDTCVIKGLESLTPARRRSGLCHHASIAVLRGDVASIRRAIIMAGASRSLDDFEHDVVRLLDPGSRCPFVVAVYDDAVAFLAAAIERFRMDIEQFEFEESDIKAVNSANARLSSDRRRANLSRMAFRHLRAGTTRSGLAAYMADANGTLASPLPPNDLQKLTDWCIARHIEDVSAKKGGQSHAA